MMIVKRNIISGLLLFSITVTLGPYMMRDLWQEEAIVNLRTELFGAFADLRVARDAVIGEDAGASESDDMANSENDVPVVNEVSLDDVSTLAVAAARAARAHARYDRVDSRAGNIRFTHAHGNLQGILNIILGLFLGKLAVDRRVQLAISWGFIVGSWTMVGSAFLGNMLDMRWALQGILPGGVILIAALYILVLSVIIKGFAEEAQS